MSGSYPVGANQISAAFLQTRASVEVKTVMEAVRAAEPSLDPRRAHAMSQWLDRVSLLGTEPLQALYADFQARYAAAASSGTGYTFTPEMGTVYEKEARLDALALQKLLELRGQSPAGVRSEASAATRGAGIRVEQKNILSLPVDGIVNPTDSSFSASGGLDRLVHLAAGPGLREAVAPLGRLEPSAAVVTPTPPNAKLPARNVVHVAGSRWTGREADLQRLRTAYENVFRAAKESGLRSVALPALGTGSLGVPLEVSAREAVRAAKAFEADFDQIHLCAIDSRGVEAFNAALRAGPEAAANPTDQFEFKRSELFAPLSPGYPLKSGQDTGVYNPVDAAPKGSAPVIHAGLRRRFGEQALREGLDRARFALAQTAPHKAFMLDRILSAQPPADWLHTEKEREVSLTKLVAVPMEWLGSFKLEGSWSEWSRGFTTAEGPFEYAPAEPGKRVWHLNFADQDLFYGAYTNLFAQDEIQIAEHPELYVIRKSLEETKSNQLGPIEVGGSDDHRAQSPALITGLSRRCDIRTQVNGKSFYGAAFQSAGPSELQAMTQVLSRPTETNLISMAALRTPGSGASYTREDIRYLFQVALTAFSGAKQASGGLPVQVKTGNWGSGAFGNNATLMAIIQMSAARLAGVDELQYHPFDDRGQAAYAEAERWLAQFVDAQGSFTVDTLVEALLREPFARFNETDGN